MQSVTHSGRNTPKMNNLKLVESMITANDTNDLERFTKEHKEKFSKLNVMEQSPKIKFQKDGV